MFWFILIATIISGILGIIILKLLIYIESQLTITGTIISLIIGILLLCTGTILLISKKTGTKEIKDLKKRDYILLGILQGLEVLPGISRSGITSSGLLLRNFKPKVALRLSFILSIPIVLGGNIILNISNFIFDYELLLGLIFSFLFGIITIHLLIKIAEKINFGILLILFGIITILGTYYCNYSTFFAEYASNITVSFVSKLVIIHSSLNMVSISSIFIFPHKVPNKFRNDSIEILGSNIFSELTSTSCKDNLDNELNIFNNGFL
jgi:hypothetical protein